MSNLVDVEAYRNKLLSEKVEIEKKLQMLDEMQQMINDKDNVVDEATTSLTTNVNDRYSNLKIVKACELFFNKNTDRYYSIRGVFQQLQLGGVSLNKKSGYTVVSQTLSRLEKKDFFITKKEGKIKFYKRKMKEEYLSGQKDLKVRTRIPLLQNKIES